MTLKKAYDSISRIILWISVEDIGILAKINVAKNLYKQNSVSIKVANKISIIFKTTKGLVQGCSPSPTLFKTVLEQALAPWKRK